MVIVATTNGDELKVGEDRPDSHQYADDYLEVAAFNDTVDAAFLDHLYESGRLQSVTA
jgi:hypothetical protein